MSWVTTSCVDVSWVMTFLQYPRSECATDIQYVHPLITTHEPRSFWSLSTAPLRYSCTCTQKIDSHLYAHIGIHRVPTISRPLCGTSLAVQSDPLTLMMPLSDIIPTGDCIYRGTFQKLGCILFGIERM